MKKVLVFGFAVLILQGISSSLQAATYYLSPSGYDSSPGTAAQPWATFGRAWQSIAPGDTLILLDGIYYSSLQPPFGGQPGAPITIRAMNDGKAVVDGEYVRTPVLLANYRNAHYIVIEGIVARNGSISPAPQQVVYIETDHNILRRVTAYNAEPDENTAVIGLGATADYNLVEDCVAAGTGRKMINVYKGNYNIIRRCVAYWLGWDGKSSCQNWPQVTSIHVYNGSHNIVENSIGIGGVAYNSITVHANAPGAQAIDNKVLGSIAINAGMNPDGSAVQWPQTRPQPTTCNPDQVYDFVTWQALRVGFSLYCHAEGEARDNVFRDVLATNNAGRGMSVIPAPLFSGNRLERATFKGNGRGLVSDGGPGADVIYNEMQAVNPTDSIISQVRSVQGASYPPYTGRGAQLRYRYVDGVLMDGSNGQPAQSLWPWPMEDRIRSEMGISVTNIVAQVIPEQVTALGPVTQPRLEASIMFAPTLSSSTPRTMTLTNKSGSSLSVNAYVFGKTSSSPYTVNGGTCPSLPFSLAASNSCTIQVALKAGVTGTAEDYLAFYSPQAPAYPFSARVFLSNAGTQITNSTPPPATAIPLPGKLEAEAYGQSGGVFTMKSTTDAGGGLKISDIQAGAWVEYPVSVSQTGSYPVVARVASASTASKSFSLLVDGVKVHTFSPATTGGWDSFVDLAGPTLNLTQGNHTVRIAFSTGGYDINYMTFGATAATPPSAPQNLHIQSIQ